MTASGADFGGYVQQVPRMMQPHGYTNRGFLKLEQLAQLDLKNASVGNFGAIDSSVKSITGIMTPPDACDKAIRHTGEHLSNAIT